MINISFFRQKLGLLKIIYVSIFYIYFYLLKNNFY